MHVIQVLLGHKKLSSRPPRSTPRWQPRRCVRWSAPFSAGHRIALLCNRSGVRPSD